MSLLGYLINRARREQEIKEGRKESRPPFSIKDIFLPKPTRAFLLRLAIVGLVAWIVFKWLCLPMYIDGESMEPTYKTGGFNFCWAPAYWLSSPKRGDALVVKYAGRKLMLLKRALAFEGETVEFRDGRLFVDGKLIEEPYVKGPCDWTMAPRKVAKGCVFIVGDNRSVPLEAHKFGEVEVKRIAGAPLW